MKKYYEVLFKESDEGYTVANALQGKFGGFVSGTPDYYLWTGYATKGAIYRAIALACLFRKVRVWPIAIHEV